MADTDDFAAAQERVKQLAKRPSDAQLLELYALFKQATVGDVQGARPGFLDLKGRAKHDAWAARRGLGAAEARQRYVALVGALVAGLGTAR